MISIQLRLGLSFFGRFLRRTVGVVPVLALVGACAIAYGQRATPPTEAALKSTASTEALPITKFAKERGFVKCAGALEVAERNLLGSSDYAFRAYPQTVQRTSPSKESTVFTAIVDSRKRNPNDAAPRATLNLTVLASQQVANACTTIYEQTTYHAATCDAVVAQMAPNGRQSANPSFGAVLIEISDNLTLTVIPVGTAQCITIIKEAAFDVPIVATPPRR